MSEPYSSLKKIKKICACGATGCVIYPGVDCGESKCVGESCKKAVATKFFVEDENYTKEMSVFDTNNKQLKRLDEDENYFLSSYKKCGKIEETADIKNLCKTIPKKKVKKVEVNFSVFDVSKDYKEKVIDELDWMKRGSSLESSLKESIPQTPLYNSINFSYLGEPMQNVLPNLKTVKEIKQFLISVKNVFEGIQILNEAEIYHCDIKPANLVLDDVDKKFKIIDFGQAIFKGSPEPQNSEWQMGDDITGYTAGFVSPEYFFRLLKLYPDVTFFGDAENFEYVENLEYKKNTNSQKKSGSLKNHDKDKIIRHLNSYYNKKNELLKHHILDMMRANYYDELSENEPAKTYIKNDIWSMGCVLRYIRSELLVKYEYATGNLRIFLMNVIVGLSFVFKELVKLDVDQRPTPSKALDLYNDFLNETTSRFSSTRKGGRKMRTRKRLTRKKRKIYNK